MKILKRTFLLMITILTLSSQKNIKLEITDITLEYPWGMTWIDSHLMLITQKNGKIYRVDTIDDTKVEIKHSIPSVHVGQGGLLDIVSDGNSIYISCSISKNGKFTTALYKSTLSGNSLIDSELLFEALPYMMSTKHFGSRIEIKDEFIYMTIGDRDGGMVAQDYTNSVGAVVRLNKDGTIPKTNQNVTNKEWSPELYQIGVRNPQGISTNPLTGEIFISNHGPKGGDFIGPVLGGTNYGWKHIGWGGTNYNGTIIGSGKSWEPGFIRPSYIWTPSIGIGGIKFYTGKLFPDWENQLLVASLKFKYLSLLKFNNNNKPVEEEIIVKDKIGRIRDIEINDKGEVFLIADEKDTRLYKLTL